MGIREDYKQAVELVKQGDYVKARNLLIVHDHAKTNQLLERVEKLITGDTGTKRKSEDAPKSFYTKLALSVLLTFTFFLPGLLCTIFFSKQAKMYPNVAGAKAILIYNKILFGLLALFVVAGVLFSLSIIL